MRVVVTRSTAPLIWYHAGLCGACPHQDDEMRPEYDFRGGERGKYYERYWTDAPTVRRERVSRWRQIRDYLTVLYR